MIGTSVTLEQIEIGGATAQVAVWGRNLCNNRDLSYVVDYILQVGSYERALTFGAVVTIEF